MGTIALTATTDNLQIVLGGSVTTNQLRCISCWRDITTTTFTPGRTVTNTNNTTDVDLVPAPGASTQRVIDYVNIYNHDTAESVVTVKFNANGTEYIEAKVTLAPQERLEYSMGGWRVYTSSGALKTVVQGGNNATSSNWTTVVLGSDVTNNNAVANTIANVTGLSFSVVAGNTYQYRALIIYTAAATTTGSRWAVNHPGGTLYGMSKYSLTGTSETINHGVTAVDSPAACNATSASTGCNIAIVQGMFTASANGTFIIRFASEVASSAIVAKAGSILEYQQVL